MSTGKRHIIRDPNRIAEKTFSQSHQISSNIQAFLGQKIPGGKSRNFWMVAFVYTLRVKTIYMEEQDKSGIRMSNEQFINDVNISKLVENEFSDINLYGMLNTFVKDVIKFDIFRGVNFIKWTDIRITKAQAKLILKSTANCGIFDSLLDNLVDIMRGNLYDTDRRYIRQICFGDVFLKKAQQFTIVVSVLPQRVPMFKDVDEQGYRLQEPFQLVGFKIKQYMTIGALYLRKKNNTKDQDKLLEESYAHIRSLKGNQHAYDCFLPNHVLLNTPFEKRKKLAFEKVTAIVDELYDKDRDEYSLVPKNFSKYTLEPEIIKSFTYDKELKMWVFPKEFENLKDIFKQVNEDIADKVQDEKGAEQILKLIKSIPQIKFHLTPEQEKMIGTPTNLLCLGRSGTGKTTSSALRLFSTDIVYKYIEEYQKYLKYEDKSKKFIIDPNFVDKPANLRLVFVTASPVLTNEVKKFYTDMKTHFKQQLISHREKKSPSKNDKNEDEIIIVDEQSSLDASMTTDQSKKDYNEYIEMEQNVIIDDEEYEKQLKLPNSIDDLTNEHFPLFVTIKRLIYMIDASMDFPFFSRNAQGQIIGMESNVEWHNESKGVFMINQYYKQSQDYDEKIKKLGKQIVEFDQELEMQPNLLFDESDNAKVENEIDAEGDFGMFSAQSDMSEQITNTDTSSKYNVQNRSLSFEVDFEIFRFRFWPKVKPLTKLTPIVIWTEIYSVIKGGADSYHYYNCTLPLSQYLLLVTSTRNRKKDNEVSGQSFLTHLERLLIYHIFLQYEQWKQEMKAYDFMDVVNHILKQTRSGFFRQSQRIQFLMVDEVQDLTPNILRLLMKMTDRNVFFCGDTAQTIAKGVGFRFYDLKKIFTKKELQMPQVLQLTKNFRSHSKILDLANSIISLLELIFPKTIDKLMKETSDTDGPKPIMIDPAYREDQLRQLLFSRAFSNQTFQDISQQNNEDIKPQFGCNQVIIVRDQESKKFIPEFLSNMLCLTVYEAKGLEFDDVILFNFFEDSKCDSQWKLLQDVDYVVDIVRRNKEFKFLDFEQLNIDENELEQRFIEENKEDQVRNVIQLGDEEIETTYQLKRDRQEVYRRFAQLCTELKLLYVAITRPKKVLIIYDSDLKNRKPLQEFWVKQGLVDHIPKEQIENPALLKPEVAQLLKQELNEQKGASKKEWMQQGIMLLKKKFYLSAIQCFRNSGDEDLLIRSQAYMHADKATQLQGECDQRIMQGKNKAFKIQERNQFKKEALELKKEARSEMMKAGEFFEKIKMYKHAAQCYCSTKNLEKAALMFEGEQEYGQSAECFLKAGNFKKAAEWYAKAKLFANAFECFERLQDWEGLLICLSRNKDFFKKEERDSLIEKYFPIALNSLYQLYTNLDPNFSDMDEENKGKLQEMKIKLKYQKSISVIREDADEDLEELDEEEEQDTTIQQEKTLEQQLIEKRLQQQNQSQSIEVLSEQEEEDKINQSEEIQINTSTKKQKKTEQMIESMISNERSFEVVEDEESKQEIQEEQNQNQAHANTMSDFEILSNIDPDDEFLQSKRTHSFIESILSKNDIEIKSAISEGIASEFSIIQNSKVHSIIQSIQSKISQNQLRSNQSIDLESDGSENHLKSTGSLINFLNSSKYSEIQNDRDMYAEDIVMQKIIYYISLFSEDVKLRLQEMRSKDQLGHLEVNDDPNDPFFQNQFLMIDLDNISKELLYLILDTLEHYELYRLCLIICNRYQLKERVGRYVTSIGNKYSNVKLFKFTSIESSVDKQFKTSQLKYSLIAHEAMHNVLGLIDKAFFDLDDNGKDQIQVKNQCFDSLFSQGFWKKLVFLMDIDSSLQLAYTMNDFDSFKLLFIVYKLGIKNPDLLAEALTNDQVFLSDISKHKHLDIKTKILSEEYEIFKDTENFIQEFQEMAHSKVQDRIINKKLKDYSFKITNTIMDDNHKYHKHQKDHNIYHQIKSQASLIFSLIALSTGNKFYNKVMDYLFSYQKIVQLHKNIFALFNLACQKSNNQKGVTKKLKKINNEVKRVIYKAFGVSLLDDFDTFSSFNSHYCIMNATSPIFSFVKAKQQNALTLFKNKVCEKIALPNQIQFVFDHQLHNYVKNIFNAQIKDINAHKDISSTRLALACDMNMQYFLVPTEWIDDIISVNIVNSKIIILFIINLQIRFCSEITTLSYQNAKSVLETHYTQLALQRQIEKTLKIQSKEINKKDQEMFDQNKQVFKLRATLHSLLENLKKDPIIDIIDAIKVTLTNDKTIKSYFIQENKQTFDIEQSLQLKPYEPHRQKKLTPLLRSTLLDIAFSDSNTALNAQPSTFYTYMIQAFNGFAYTDDLFYFQEIIRFQRRAIKKQVKLKASKAVDLDKRLKNMYLLLDVNVYLKCNAWESAVDSLFQFIDATVSHLNFDQILNFIEAGFYRIILNYYLLRLQNKDQGVMIPNYAMKHIEPSSNFNSIPIQNKPKCYQVQELKYHQVLLQDVKTLKLVGLAFDWCIQLIKALNKDEQSFMSGQIYYRVFNMIVVFMLNTTPKEINQNYEISNKIAQLARFLSESQHEKYFKDCNLWRNKEHIPNEILKMKEKNLVTLCQLLRFQKGETYSFVKVYMGEFISTARVKNINQIVDSALNKAYYEEQRVLAQHLAAANMIKNAFLRRRQGLTLKKQKSIEKHEKVSQSIRDQQIQEQLKHFSSTIVEKIKNNIDKQEHYQQILINLLSSKLIITSFDLHYIKNKLEHASEQNQKFRTYLKQYKPDKKEERKLNESRIDNEDVKAFLNKNYNFLVNEITSLQQWLDTNSDMKLIELEKKALNMRTKWEDLVQFQKRKKIVLKHLFKKNQK